MLSVSFTVSSGLHQSRQRMQDAGRSPRYIPSLPGGEQEGAWSAVGSSHRGWYKCSCWCGMAALLKSLLKGSPLPSSPPAFPLSHPSSAQTTELYCLTVLEAKRLAWCWLGWCLVRAVKEILFDAASCGFWWFAGNCWHSLACRSITVMSSFIFTWCPL